MRTKTFSSLTMLAAGLFAFSATALHAQVGINSTAANPDASAILDLNTGNAGVNKGFLPPQVALTNVATAAPVTTPATGLIVYSTSAPTGGDGTGYYYWNGTGWIGIAGGSAGAIGGSGINGYVAIWTPNGTTLGTGSIQDDGAEIGVGTTPNSGTEIWAMGVNEAVYGEATDASGGYAGVFGRDDGGGPGTYGTSVSGPGVWGVATTTGVRGDGDTAVAAYGYYNGITAYGPNYGIYASSPAGWPVFAISPGSEEGVFGECDGSNGWGVNGYSQGATGIGVVGEDDAAAGYGVEGTSGSGIGVYAAGGTYGSYSVDANADYLIGGHPADASAGYFNNANGDYGWLAYGTLDEGGYFEDAGGDYSYISYAGYGILSNGTKSTEVKDENNQERVLFCDESPEVVFHDYGTSQLVNGKVHINLDPLYSKTVAINEKHPLRVMVTLNDECNGIFVKNRTATGFDVIELNHGTSNAQFTYEVIANRADTKNAKGEVYDYSNWRYPVGPGSQAKPTQTALQPNVTKKRPVASTNIHGVNKGEKRDLRAGLLPGQTSSPGKN